jgi:glycosyltransferase involved in cell wall biosynthesis
MKIAQVAPLRESVPPKRHGGTERIVSYLTEELVRLGHDVTLFAAGDSSTSASLYAACPSSIRSTPKISFPDALYVLLLERAFGTYAGNFDLIHSHIDLLGFPLARRCSTPVFTTVHTRLDLPELIPVFEQFSELPLVSISDAQRSFRPGANWQRTIHPGLPRNLYSMHPHLGKYLAFLGRISPDSGVEQAVELAKRTAIPIRIAARVDPADKNYFEHIAPLFEHPLVEYLGEVTDEEKDDFLGDAYALICPADRPEPFGLVLVEAFACGTPVLAYRRGCIPEIVHHGSTGYLSDTLEEMANTVAWVPNLDRRRCRTTFEERFTVERMVQDYLLLYQGAVHNESDQSTDQVPCQVMQPSSSVLTDDARIDRRRHIVKQHKAGQLAV